MESNIKNLPLPDFFHIEEDGSIDFGWYTGEQGKENSIGVTFTFVPDDGFIVLKSYLDDNKKLRYSSHEGNPKLIGSFLKKSLEEIYEK